MLLFDRKRALNQIMGPPPEEIREEVDPAHLLAQEAMDAFANKDAAGFANATRAMFEHYQSMPVMGNSGGDSSEGA